MASPDPRRVVEQRAISDLVEAGTVVICGSGGGAAVTVDAVGRLTGVEAVIDKDYVAALLAVAVRADRLLALTDAAALLAGTAGTTITRADRADRAGLNRAPARLGATE